MSGVRQAEVVGEAGLSRVLGASSQQCPPLGSFYKGVAEGEVDPAFGPLEALRLSIQTDSPVWVILSEVRQNRAGHRNRSYSH